MAVRRRPRLAVKHKPGHVRRPATIRQKAAARRSLTKARVRVLRPARPHRPPVRKKAPRPVRRHVAVKPRRPVRVKSRRRVSVKRRRRVA